MKLETMWEVATSGRVRALSGMLGLAAPFYRVQFLVTAARAGLLRLLAAEPRDAAAIARTLEIAEGDTAALEAWLEVGVSVGDLELSGGRYALDGALAKALARPENDDLLAMMEEVQSLHARLVSDTPALLRKGEKLTLKDQDGEVIARSSRLLEPLVREAVAMVIPEKGPLRVLEVGCGSGVYLRHMHERNPEATIVGRELQPEVAEAARRNLAAWGVSGRVTVETGDVRTRDAGDAFDVVTLHNNIYYFEEANRPAVLRDIARHLAPGGSMLLTTACRGGSPGVAVLSLWGAMTAGCGRLPAPEELRAQMREAGLDPVTARNIGAPLESFWAFVGKKAG